MSSETRVVNIYHTDDWDVNCMRPNLLGNPFVVGKHGTRDEVIAKFEDYIRKEPIRLRYIKTLKGKTLACCCKPKSCHVDIIAKIAEEE